jgi:hypothetical protein
VAAQEVLGLPECAGEVEYHLLALEFGAVLVAGFDEPPLRLEGGEIALR